MRDETLEDESEEIRAPEGNDKREVRADVLFTFAEADRKVREEEAKSRKGPKGTFINYPLTECSDVHEWGSVRGCEKYLMMPLEQRRKTALTKKLCFK